MASHTQGLHKSSRTCLALNRDQAAITQSVVSQALLAHMRHLAAALTLILVHVPLIALYSLAPRRRPGMTYHLPGSLTKRPTASLQLPSCPQGQRPTNRLAIPSTATHPY
ncbi:unnamed protein product [Polarella glacialis]|uniref:Uncharacterized protein n=1 Tax=Polarella glacialis TaxID=89957 RepID=A0A813LTR4_POLGL|nr:unnamed protein product [Polarella glacialis]